MESNPVTNLKEQVVAAFKEDHAEMVLTIKNMESLKKYFKCKAFY
jgi:hypothetical protein